MTYQSIIATAAALTGLAIAPANDSWNVDANHTEVTFEVRHFFTPVTGKFDQFDVQLAFDAEDPTRSSVSAVIQVASVDTNNDRRDAHLRTADFFEAQRWPEIRFQSTKVRVESETRFVAVGDLTIKGTTREVELPIELLGVQDVPGAMQEMIGAERVASFRSELTIDRGDFEVGTGSWAETAIVGSDVKIALLLEANQ